MIKIVVRTVNLSHTLLHSYYCSKPIYIIICQCCQSMSNDLSMSRDRSVIHCIYVQTCQLKFGSWTFDGGKLDIRQLNDWDGLDLDTYTRSKEWEIVSSPCERNQTTRGNTAYPNLVYTLTIRRTAVTYVFLLIIPCILLSVLNLVIFWLPPEAPAKMMLGKRS